MNDDLKMTAPMWVIEENLPEYAVGWQQAFMDLYEELPNELDPQLAFIVRNLAYQRVIAVHQQETINFLVNTLAEILVPDSEPNDFPV